MYLFHVIFVILFLTSVLTLSTKKIKTLDRENADNSSSKIEKSVVKNSIQNDSTISPNKVFPVNKIQQLKISNSSQLALESGGQVNFTSLPAKSDSQESQKDVSSSTKNSLKEGNQKERNVIPRKEVSLPDRIKARKGVGNETVSSGTNSSLDNSKLNVNSSSVQSLTTMEKSKEIVVPTLDINLNTTRQNVSSVTKTPPKITTEKMKKHKLKPTVTIGGANVDQPIPASPTKSPPLGMPRKIDYIVPIMITIFTVPLLSIATYVLYRRGRDCWDKRHYRRMDFLIDGMYNE